VFNNREAAEKAFDKIGAKNVGPANYIFETALT
jgi:hypothetical protein